MYSNNVLNFQESTTILNACTKKSGNLLKAPRKLNFEFKTEFEIFACNSKVDYVFVYKLGM